RSPWGESTSGRMRARASSTPRRFFTDFRDEKWSVSCGRVHSRGPCQLPIIASPTMTNERRSREAANCRNSEGAVINWWPSTFVHWKSATRCRTTPGRRIRRFRSAVDTCSCPYALEQVGEAGVAGKGLLGLRLAPAEHRGEVLCGGLHAGDLGGLGVLEV